MFFFLFQIGEVSIEGSIFSSCCVLELESQNTPSRTGTEKPANSSSNSGTKILCGAHDRRLHCWNDRLEPEWEVELDSEIYSTPFHCHIGHAQSTTITAAATSNSCTVLHDCVCVCSVRGVIYLVDVCSSSVLGSHRLPGDVFSSPVSLDNLLVVGCRDDHIYCVQLTLT